jgi:hypothetical protein
MHLFLGPIAWLQRFGVSLYMPKANCKKCFKFPDILTYFNSPFHRYNGRLPMAIYVCNTVRDGCPGPNRNLPQQEELP